jgi:hypothetical protein
LQLARDLIQSREELAQKLFAGGQIVWQLSGSIHQL